MAEGMGLLRLSAAAMMLLLSMASIEYAGRLVTEDNRLVYEIRGDEVRIRFIDGPLSMICWGTLTIDLREYAEKAPWQRLVPVSESAVSRAADEVIENMISVLFRNTSSMTVFTSNRTIVLHGSGHLASLLWSVGMTVALLIALYIMVAGDESIVKALVIGFSYPLLYLGAVLGLVIVLNGFGCR